MKNKKSKCKKCKRPISATSSYVVTGNGKYCDDRCAFYDAIFIK